jgi:DNA-3-methyladenine glycosylase II
MLLTLESEDDIKAAVNGLLTVEPRFGRVVDTHGLPPLRRMDDGLKGLLRIVTDQLISLKAGEAIWRRIDIELSPFDAARISRMREASLMRLGLSGAKARCFKSVAKAVFDGSFSFERLRSLSDSDVLANLMALKGIGPWTADIYLLAAMGRADAWPAGDLAVQVGAQHLFDIPERPGPRHLASLAEPWRPWRSVAARLLWSHYRGLKGMSQSVT